MAFLHRFYCILFWLFYTDEQLRTLSKKSVIGYAVNVLKFQTLLFLFSNKMMVIHKMLIRIANREDPDQTASSEAVSSGSALFV